MSFISDLKSDELKAKRRLISCILDIRCLSDARNILYAIQHSKNIFKDELIQVLNKQTVKIQRVEDESTLNKLMHDVDAIGRAFKFKGKLPKNDILSCKKRLSTIKIKNQRYYNTLHMLNGLISKLEGR